MEPLPEQEWQQNLQKPLHKGRVSELKDYREFKKHYVKVCKKL
jgi:hypothetical protein